MSGIDLRATERFRQIAKEGWTAAHDDQHVEDEMPQAAVTYIAEAARILHGFKPQIDGRGLPFGWPWAWTSEWYKPSPDPIRNLVKAGALIAAEIDRLQRAKESTDAHH